MDRSPGKVACVGVIAHAAESTPEGAIGIKVSRLSLLLLPALLGAVLVLYATGVYGAGVNSDSVYYYNAGYNLLARGAFVTTLSPGQAPPLTHFPPLYPALLAPLHLSNTGIEYSVRILNASLIVLYIVAVQLLVLRATDGSFTAALLAGFYTVLSTATLTIYARMWSETLFLVLFLFGVLLLFRYLQRGDMQFLLAGAILFALAWLARYVGVTLIAGGGLAILLWSVRPVRHRLRDALLFGVVAAAPMGLFLLRNLVVAGEATDRALAFHPVPPAWWRNGVDTLSAWLIPVAAPDWMKAVAALSVIAIALVGLYFVVADSRRTPASGEASPRPWIVPAILLLFTAIYLGFFYAVVTFADTGDLSGRTLSPVYSSLVVVAAYAGHSLARRYGYLRPALVTGAVVVLCGGLLGVQLLRSTVWAGQARADGFDLSSRSWRESAAVDYLQALPEDVQLYSNWPHIGFFHTGRLAYPIPFAQCESGCQEADALVLHVPDIHADSAVIVWADYLGGGGCTGCLLTAAGKLGFAPVYQDDHFLLLAPDTRSASRLDSALVHSVTIPPDVRHSAVVRSATQREGDWRMMVGPSRWEER